MWVGLIQSGEGLTRTNSLTPSKLEEPPDGLGAGTPFDPLAFRLEMKHGLFLGLEPTSSQTETYTMSSPGCSACWLQILELLSLYNHMSQCFTINTFIMCVCLSVCLCLYPPLVCFSGELYTHALGC